MAIDIMGMDEAETVNGKSVTIKVVNGTVMIDDAEVTMADVECANGVIHVIDTVLMP